MYIITSNILSYRILFSPFPKFLQERGWPAQFPGAPYEVKLDIGSQVFALVDHSGLIQREARDTLRATGGYAVPKGGRFQKRQKADGSGLEEATQATTTTTTTTTTTKTRTRTTTTNCFAPRLGTPGHQERQGQRLLPA